MTPAFQHMTVPVDGSATSERGVAFAIELARDGGRLTFCSVVDPTLVCLSASYGVAIDPGPMLETLDEDAGVFCRRAQDDAAAAHIDADTLVLHGQCAEAIESFTRHNGTQAIVIGTHGRSGVARAALGSVAEALIRGSGVPVVAVHEDDAMRTGPIGVAIDASPAAQAALDTAIRIAAARGIPLALIHVCDASDAKAPQVNALLDEAARRARAGGARTDVHVCQGDVEPAIRGTAERLECCMIAMGTHGRHPLGRLVFGSVAAAVVEHATVPVLTVR